MARALNVLISAYACEPGKGSEPEDGWQWSLQMARRHAVTVLTRSNNRGLIEAGLAGHTGPVPRFHYYDLPRWLVACKRRGMPATLYYVLWQLGARWSMRRRWRAFDLIHHVTFNSFLFPGFWWVRSVPVILGPLGGGQVCPWRLLPWFGRQAGGEALRSLWVSLSWLSPVQHCCYGFARRIVVATDDTQRRIPRWYQRKVARLLEIGYDRARLGPRPAGAAAKTGQRLIWIGRLERRKGLGLAIRALARARRQNAALRLTVVGDGAGAAAGRALAVRLGCAACIDWRGRQPFAEVPRLLAEHDILLFTSLRDTTGTVILEAMAAGLPVITLRHQGAGEITTDETAVRVVPGGPGRTVAAYAAAIVELSGSAARRIALGRAGRDRLEACYCWDTLGERMHALYLELGEGRRVAEVERAG